MAFEVCIDHVDSALAAVGGGADRIEICSELSVGGLTPSSAFFSRVVSMTSLPHRVMIRPRSGDFHYDNHELAVMEEDIRRFSAQGAHGFVFGVLDSDSSLCLAGCGRLLAAANGLPCTLHRAIDLTPDWRKTLHDAIQLGFDTVLSSGQKETAPEGAATLREMHAAVAGRIHVMAGSGVNESSIARLLEETSLHWFHGSASSALPSPMKPTPRIAMGPLETGTQRRSDKKKIATIVDLIHSKRQLP